MGDPFFWTCFSHLLLRWKNQKFSSCRIGTPSRTVTYMINISLLGVLLCFCRQLWFSGYVYSLVKNSINILTTCMYLQAINEKDVPNIVMSYLIHNCYEESAESFIASTGSKRPTDYLDNMEKRKSMFIVVFQFSRLVIEKFWLLVLISFIATWNICCFLTIVCHVWLFSHAVYVFSFIPLN